MKQSAPQLVAANRKVQAAYRWAKGQLRSREAAFRAVYSSNRWNNADSVSGHGSDLVQTNIVRAALPAIFKKYAIQSVLDAPCGDFFWMSKVELSAVHYIGCDIVPDLIAKNNAKYGSGRISFLKKDIVSDELPRSDLVFCRDCLVHLRLGDAKAAVNNIIASGAKYLLVTTFPNTTENVQTLVTGDWRALNLERPPFSLPPPLELLDEQCPEPGFTDKSLGLWRVEDMRSR